jgi:hypothetical protein
VTIRWTIDKERGFFHEVWEGPIRAEDECAAIEEATADPRYGPGMRGMVDMRRASIEFGEEGIDAIFRKKREYGSLHVGWRWALVAATTEQLATCAMYTSRIAYTPIEMLVFQDDREALEWLELEPAEVSS